MFVCLKICANFPYVQINPFMAAADVFCRRYPVLPISQPSGKSVQGGIIAWSCVQGVMALKKPHILPGNQIGDVYVINCLQKALSPFSLLFKSGVSLSWLRGGVFFALCRPHRLSRGSAAASSPAAGGRGPSSAAGPDTILSYDEIIV